jgi:hypothetical protein
MFVNALPKKYHRLHVYRINFLKAKIQGILLEKACAHFKVENEISLQIEGSVSCDLFRQPQKA